MRVVAIATDLMMVSRIAAAADVAAVTLTRLRSPRELGPVADTDLVIVDWAEREPWWAESLVAWRADAQVPIVLFGQHTDREAHRAAREAGLGPMWARSRLMRELPRLVAPAR
ncbi:MAG: hypothetical protein ABI534_00080 [Chloroflexota bacterium]